LLESRSALHSDWTVERDAYEVFRGFSPTEIAEVSALLERRSFRQGDVLINIGDQADHLYLLARGQVSAVLPRENGERRRLATMSAGMAFGELALLDRAPRSAIVVADTEVACDLLSLEAVHALRAQHPGIIIKLLENLALALCSKLRKATREVAVLD
jgi:glutaminase